MVVTEVDTGARHLDRVASARLINGQAGEEGHAVTGRCGDRAAERRVAGVGREGRRQGAVEARGQVAVLVFRLDLEAELECRPSDCWADR